MGNAAIGGRAKAVAGRLAVGIAVGLGLGAACWAVELARRGHGILAALRGEVEDGLGLLQGLAALGGLCGAAVGLGTGLVVAARTEAEPVAALDPAPPFDFR
jgi:hypothetical protein